MIQTSRLKLIIAPLLMLFSVLSHADSAKIAIIIDDLGYDKQLGQRSIDLPGKITVSILPDTPHARDLAYQAHAQDRDILVHLPMQAQNHNHGHERHLHSEMPKDEFITHLRSQLASIPFAAGVNNHKGSLLTTMPSAMEWLMLELKQWDIYYVDSRTTAATVAAPIARTHGLAYAERDVFLDHQLNRNYLENQFARLIGKAKKNGQAIAIAHPHELTLSFLEEMLPTLAEHNIELVYVKQLTQKESTDTWQASLSPSPKAVKN
jgi:polysaccharide deacetylase 2 family uncharacterized protein YibQ